jgi:hypothetical protein
VLPVHQDSFTLQLLHASDYGKCTTAAFTGEKNIQHVKTRVADPYSLNTDPDPTFLRSLESLHIRILRFRMPYFQILFESCITFNTVCTSSIFLKRKKCEKMMFFSYLCFKVNG